MFHRKKSPYLPWAYVSQKDIAVFTLGICFTERHRHIYPGHMIHRKTSPYLHMLTYSYPRSQEHSFHIQLLPYLPMLAQAHKGIYLTESYCHIYPCLSKLTRAYISQKFKLLPYLPMLAQAHMGMSHLPC